MRAQLFFRKIHLWGAFVVALPMLVMIVAGILLMVKKDFAWIQPPTQKGMAREAVPSQTFEQLFAVVVATPEMAIDQWSQLARVDVKPGKGIAKFVSHNNWELQLDTRSGEVLQLALRRSDVIESIHDGSWFANWIKRGLFLPTGIVMFVLWMTGIYLFILPYYNKAHRRNRLAAKLR